MYSYATSALAAVHRADQVVGAHAHRRARSITRLWVGAAVAAIAVFAAWPSLTERPQVAGFVLLVPVIAAWWKTAQDRQPRWYLIPLTWLAAATHGIWATGLVIGALVAGTLWVTRRLDRRQTVRLGAVLAGSLAAAAVTPVGPRLLLTPLSVSSQGRQFVQEWLPSSVRSPVGSTSPQSATPSGCSAKNSR